MNENTFSLTMAARLMVCLC